MNEPPVIISICGNVASGKSTLAASLSEWIGIPAIFEDTSRISLFEEYCENPRKWAATTQIQFLTDKFSRALSSHLHRTTILDRSFEEDAFVFVGHHAAVGNITEQEHRKYVQIYNAMMSFLPARRLMVYVHCSQEERLRRLKYRSQFEQRMLDVEYLDALAGRYNEFFLQQRFDFEFDSEKDDPRDFLKALQLHL